MMMVTKNQIYLEFLFLALAGFCVCSFYLTVVKEQREEHESYLRMQRTVREELNRQFLR